MKLRERSGAEGKDTNYLAWCDRQRESAPFDEHADFVDWSTYSDGAIFFSFAEFVYYVVSKDVCMDESNCVLECGYKAFTKNVPKNFPAALSDPVWGDPARAEWTNIHEAKVLVQVDRQAAMADVRKGADVVTLFPVYEEKVKEGVFKAGLL